MTNKQQAVQDTDLLSKAAARQRLVQHEGIPRPQRDSHNIAGCLPDISASWFEGFIWLVDTERHEIWAPVFVAKPLATSMKKMPRMTGLLPPA